MATCLRCDACHTTVTEQDEELATWWRLDRYGSGWVPEPKREAEVKEVVVTSAMMEFGTFEIDDDEVDSEFAEDFADHILARNPPPEIVLHFCSAGCLGKWATEASALD
jgi:hypothetical protein